MKHLFSNGPGYSIGWWTDRSLQFIRRWPRTRPPPTKRSAPCVTGRRQGRQDGNPRFRFARSQGGKRCAVDGHHHQGQRQDAGLWRKLKETEIKDLVDLHPWFGQVSTQRAARSGRHGESFNSERLAGESMSTRTIRNLFAPGVALTLLLAAALPLSRSRPKKIHRNRLRTNASPATAMPP